MIAYKRKETLAHVNHLLLPIMLSRCNLKLTKKKREKSEKRGMQDSFYGKPKVGVSIEDHDRASDLSNKARAAIKLETKYENEAVE